MDPSEFREYVMKAMRQSPSAKLSGRLTLGNLRIDPTQQWGAHAHPPAASPLAQGIRRDRAAAEDITFDPAALETTTGRPRESRWTLKDLKRGKYEEQRGDIDRFPTERGAHQYPQSVYDALDDNEFALLAQLQEADLDKLDTNERELFIELHTRWREAMVEAEEAERKAAEPPVAPVEEPVEEEEEEEP